MSKPHPPTARRIRQAFEAGHTPQAPFFQAVCGLLLVLGIVASFACFFRQPLEGLVRGVWRFQQPSTTDLASMATIFAIAAVGVWVAILCLAVITRRVFFRWQLIVPTWWRHGTSSRGGSGQTREHLLGTVSSLFVATAVLGTWLVLLARPVGKGGVPWRTMVLAAIVTLLILVFWALLSLWYRRHRFYRALGMSRSDLLEELKAVGANPIWRSWRRDEGWRAVYRGDPEISAAFADPSGCLVGLALNSDGQYQLAGKWQGRAAHEVWQALDRASVPVHVGPGIVASLWTLPIGFSIDARDLKRLSGVFGWGV